MLERESAKVLKQETAERNKIAAELKKGNIEFAKVHAENAIRIRKEGLNIQRFSAKMGAVAAKLDSAYRTQQISQQIKNTVPLLERCLKTMNKMQISEQMSNFEKVFEDLDVKSADINGVLDQVVGSSVAQDEVDQLLQQMQAEQGFDVQQNMVGPGKAKVNIGQGQAQAQADDVGEMQKKLDALKGI